MDKEKLLKIINKFKNKKILVLGDIMLDKYIWGEVSRISPEAPVQIVNVLKESYAPGGAANVANNIAALNGKASMVGIVGNDEANKILLNELQKRNINVDGIFKDNNKPTIQKVRVIGRGQQLLRFDYEKKGYVDGNTESNILSFIEKNIGSFDAVAISDYAKGVITESLMRRLKEICKKNDKIIVVDPKPKHKDLYKNVDLVTPNHTEAHEISNIEIEDGNKIFEVGKALIKFFNCPVLITRGEKGMSLFELDGEVTNIPTKAKEVYDVTGAGDTSVATIALSLASGASLKEAAIIANHAAGITVGKIGTSTVSIDELKKSIENE